MSKIQSVVKGKIPLPIIESVLGIAIGVIFSHARMGQIVSPIHVAAATILSPIGAVSVFVGSCLSYVVTGQIMDNLQMIIALVLICILKITGQEKLNSSTCAILSGVSVFVGGIVSAIFTKANLYVVTAYIISSFLAAISAYFINFAYFNYRKQNKIVLKSSLMCAYAVIYILLISALINIDFNYFNVGRVAAIVITLIASKKYCHTGGVVCGSLSACGGILCSTEHGIPMIFLPVAGLLTGFMHKYNKIAVTFCFVSINLLSQLAIVDITFSYTYITDLFIGSLIYLMLRGMILEKWILAPKDRELSVSKMLEYKLKLLAGTIAGVRKDTQTVSEMLKKSGETDRILTKVSENVCEECHNKAFCWTGKYEDTRKGIKEIYNQKNSIVTQVPQILSHCIKPSEIVKKVNEEKQKVLSDNLLSSKLDENRKILFEQLKATENIIKETSKNLSVNYSNEITEIVENLLSREKYSCKRVWAYYNDLNVLTIEIYAADKKCIKSIEVLERLLSIHLKTNLISCQLIPTGHRDEIICCFHEAPEYELETYCIVRGTEENNYICGDTADMFFDGKGSQYLVISDGMGSGKSAAIESKMAVSLFRKLVRGGSSYEGAVKMINGLMYSKSDDEIFTTFDMAKIDLYTCEMTLMKSGASSTLLMQDDIVRRIGVQTFPVGVLPDADIYTSKYKLSVGDTLVMLSDGVNESEYRYIKQLLVQEKPVNKIAEEIYEKSAVFNGGKQCDDVTVVVARLKKVCQKR